MVVIGNPHCEKCPKLADNTMNVCMEGEGPLDASLMLVGEALGATEDEKNRPFVGSAGETLRVDLLPFAGIEDDWARISNAVRCHPPNNKTPTIKYVYNCREYLEAEIRIVKPKVIVALGNVPLASLLHFQYDKAEDTASTGTGKEKQSGGKISGISKWRGKRIWSPEFDCWIVPTYHPSYVRRQSSIPSEFHSKQVLSDLKFAVLLASKPRPVYPPPRLKLIETVEEANKLMAECRKAGRVAFDIETGGGEEFYEKTWIGCSFAFNLREGYYIDFRGNQLMEVVKPFLVDRSIRKIMHNGGGYEVPVLRHLGIPIWDLYDDTMIASQLIDENFPRSLKKLAWVYTTFGGYDVDLEKWKRGYKIKSDYSKIPPEKLWSYGATDALATYVIQIAFDKLLQSEGVVPLYNKIVMPVRRVMSDAEIHGFRVDVEYARDLKGKCEKAIKRVERGIFREAGKEFNLDSPQQLQGVLFKDMGFVPVKKTDVGNYSVDAEVIQTLLEETKHPIFNLLSDRSYLDTMMNTHIAQALNLMWEDGRVHTRYGFNTGTGRISAVHPSLHNVPRDRVVRGIYVADFDKGWGLMEEDLKGAEFVITCGVSGERQLIKAFDQGLDIHAETAKIIFDTEEPTKEERYRAKRINFGLVYGLTSKGLARILGIGEKEAEKFLRRYFERLPNITSWKEGQIEFAHEHGYVVSVFHRKRRLPNVQSDIRWDRERAERQASNATIQSAAAEYTYLCLVRLARTMKKESLKSKIIHTVHDDGLETYPYREEGLLKELVVEAFETRVKVLPVQMRVEIHTGYRWGEHNDSRLEGILKSTKIA